MKIISLNCRGSASHPKRLALKQLFLGDMLDVVLLKETLCSNMEIENVLRGMIGGKGNRDKLYNCEGDEYMEK